MQTRRQKNDKLKNECLSRQCKVLIQKLPNEDNLRVEPKPQTKIVASKASLSEMEKFNEEIVRKSKNLKPVPQRIESEERPKTDFERIFDEIKRKTKH